MFTLVKATNPIWFNEEKTALKFIVEDMQQSGLSFNDKILENIYGEIKKLIEDYIYIEQPSTIIIPGDRLGGALPFLISASKKISAKSRWLA